MRNAICALTIIILMALCACGASRINDTPVNAVTSGAAEGSTLSSEDQGKAFKIVNALAGALMVGQDWEKITGDSFKYDLSLMTFYCILNPDYPSEIPASEYEGFIKQYFDVSAINLQETDGYDRVKETYAVSVDISVDRAEKEINDYFRVDDYAFQDGYIKVDYHTVWGNMAPDASMEDSAVLAGHVLLDKDNNFRIVKVEVTENSSG